MKNNYVCIIPARSGSKRLKDKNIKILNNRPLIYWTIKTAQKIKKINKVIFSSDSQKYLRIAEGFGINKTNLHLRPKNFSTSKSSTEETLLDIIKSKNLYKSYKNIILLQVTSPLRTILDLTNAIHKFEKSKKSSLVSSMLINNNLILTNKNKKFFFLKNSFKSIEVTNGAIYIINLKKFIKTKSFYHKDTQTYIMDKRSSVDIDDYYDFMMADLYLHGKKK